MLHRTAALLIILFVPVLITIRISVSAAQSPDVANCRDWQDCRQLALEAADRHEYEAFHDLAWKTVQTGPPRDANLMYLLARAQCLSGRPHDALVMLRRLAEMGVATDADVNADFERTRALPGWAEVEALVDRVRSASVAAPVSSTAAAPRDNRRPSSNARPSASASTPPPASSPSSSPTAPEATPPSLPAPSVSPAPPAATASPAPTIPAGRPPPAGLPAYKPLPIENAVRVSASRFAAGGLAYDAVSRRFVVGDLRGGRLMVVSEGSDHAVDLVRADSAGFHEIRALAIDWRRGDLWVVNATADGEWSIHRLQLLSGRPLTSIPVNKALGPISLVDVAVTPGGTVLVLDAAKNRLLSLRPRGAAVEASAQLRVDEASSVTASNDEGIVYVAHSGGIARVDVRTGSTTRMAAPAGLELTGVERIRWHGTGLIAVQAAPDGSRHIAQFELNAAKRAITGAAVIDASLPATAAAPFLAISGDELSYLLPAENPSAGQPASDAPGEFVVRRIRLR